MVLYKHTLAQVLIKLCEQIAPYAAHSGHERYADVSRFRMIETNVSRLVRQKFLLPSVMLRMQKTRDCIYVLQDLHMMHVQVYRIRLALQEVCRMYEDLDAII